MASRWCREAINVFRKDDRGGGSALVAPRGISIADSGLPEAANEKEHDGTVGVV